MLGKQSLISGLKRAWRKPMPDSHLEISVDPEARLQSMIDAIDAGTIAGFSQLTVLQTDDESDASEVTQKMSIQIQCLQCGTSHQVNDRLAGRRVRCPECDTAIHVPELNAATAGGPQDAIEVDAVEVDAVEVEAVEVGGG